MGSFTVTRWRCDRCGAEFAEKPPVHYPAVTLVASEHLEWAGGILIDWKEMCHPCNTAVSKAIVQLKIEAKEPTHETQ